MYSPDTGAGRAPDSQRRSGRGAAVGKRARRTTVQHLCAGTIVFSRYPATESSGEDIWTVNIDGTNAKQLTHDGMSWDPMFVRDKIVFLSWRNNATGNEVYSMNLDGTNQKRLTNNSVNEYFDDW